MFVQLYGGPIGACITMACARLVMQSWKDGYNKILLASGINEMLSRFYVDDGRTYQRKLRWGERFDINLNKFTFDNDTKKEDMKENIDREQRSITGNELGESRPHIHHGTMLRFQE